MGDYRKSAKLSWQPQNFLEMFQIDCIIKEGDELVRDAMMSVDMPDRPVIPGQSSF